MDFRAHFWFNLSVARKRVQRSTLEETRRQAVRMCKRKVHPDDIAAALDVGRSTVFGWLALYREGGFAALRVNRPPGRSPKLSGAQLSQLYAFIVGSDPRQHQFDFALWTRELVGELIQRKFGVRLAVSSVGNLLRKMGLSVQRPLTRAYQQDPERVARWKEQEYPAIRARAAQLGATVLFLDEASVRSDYHTGTTWAPVGRTPVVTGTGARFSVNMISAVSAQGRIHFDVLDRNVNAEVFIEFLEKLRHDIDGPVFCVVDGHPAHRAKKVGEYVESTHGQVELFFLPAYSPELNPDEWVWKNVKHDTVGRKAVLDRDQLFMAVHGALQQLCDLPGIVRGFFADPNLRYIHNAQSSSLLTA